MRFTRRALLLTLILTLCMQLPVMAAVPAPAMQPLYLASGDYDPAIPTPAQFLGHPLGMKAVHPYRVVEYLETVARLSDRVSLRTIGRTHEGRPMLLVTLTSPGNHANLENIQARHLSLADPDNALGVDDEMPVILWMNYGVHGSESSGMDAVLPTVYHYSAARDPAVREILEQSILLINPIANPDGHAQRVAWLDAYGSTVPNPDPAHAEHRYSTVFSRTNHYGFDLNRQWVTVTQPESRAITTAWYEWLPNLTLDYHEMGSSRTYYFHPGIASRTNPLVPARAEELMAQSVQEAERFFDAEQRRYFHGAGYDNFFIGKGSTFPLINGGVGLLFEAGSSRGRYLASDNGTRSYRDNIRKHFRTAVASVSSAVKLRYAYLKYQAEFFKQALAEADRYDTRAFAVSADGDPYLLSTFLELLDLHGIESHSLVREIEVDDTVLSPTNTLLIPLKQPQYRLIRSLLEEAREFSDVGFYDVSTWILAPAYGLSVKALGARVYNDNLVGEKPALRSPRTTLGSGDAHAYMLEWSSYYAPKALHRVLQEGLLATTAFEASTLTTYDGVRTFPRGSVLIPAANQPLDSGALNGLLTELNDLPGVSIYALTSGNSANGSSGVDTGAPSFKPLDLPTVLLVTGDRISWYDSGEIWHLLDKRMNMPLTMVTRAQLEKIDLTGYTHIVFPGGRYARDRSLKATLRPWLQNGGTVIGLQQAARWLYANLLDSNNKKSAASDTPEAGEAGWRLRFDERKPRAAARRVGGAIFSADLDTSHPLGFGYTQPKIALHKSSSTLLAWPDSRYGTVAQYSDSPLVSGYASERNVGRIAGTAAITSTNVGDGKVILFSDNPVFRGYWYYNDKLLLNSLFLSGTY